MLRAEKQVARPYIFHAFLSPPWESLRHCLAQSMAVNTSSIGWLSLETHWSLVLFPSTHLYQGRIYSVRLFLHALRQAIQLDHWNLHLGSHSLKSQEWRGAVSLHFSSRGWGPFGENERKTEESEERNYQKKIEEGSTARPPPVLQALDKLASPSWRKTTESLQSALTLWSVLAQKERNRPSANSRTRSNHTRQGTGAMRTRGVASQNVKKNRNKGQHVYT